MQETGSGSGPAAGPEDGTRRQSAGARASDQQGPRAGLTRNLGPCYTLRHPDRTEILQVHEDRARTGVWRVSYPDGRSDQHSGIGGARRQAQSDLARLGYVNSLDTMVS